MARDGRAGRALRGLRRLPLLLVALGLLAGLAVLVRSTDSPDQRAEASRSPAAPVVTAAVERRVLRDLLVLNGEVTTTGTLEVALPPATGGEGEVAGRAVVTTGAPEVGASVDAGALLVAVSGQPVFLIQGDLPLYRTIRPGDSGPDVLGLQRGLAGAGYPVEADGTYGPGTWSAVEELWQAHGFEPVVDGALEEQIEAAADALDDRRSEYEAAVASARATGTPAPDTSAQIRAAEEELEELRATFGPLVTPDSFVVAPVVPATVVASRARLGDDLAAGGTGSEVDVAGEGEGSNALLELSASAPVVVVEATAAQASLLEPGLTATMVIDGVEVTAPIDAVGTVGAAGTARVVLRPDPAPGLDLLGTPVTAEVETMSSGGPVLAVPTSALRSSPGRPEQVVRITRDRGGDVRTVVAVETGSVIGGWVEITSAAPALSPEDRVVVGE